jgi:hypothetical protein
MTEKISEVKESRNMQSSTEEIKGGDEVVSKGPHENELKDSSTGSVST